MFNKITVIAEIGINHNGNISLAKKMMLLAKNCGCDYVKFKKEHLKYLLHLIKKN